MSISLVVACDLDGCIGRDGTLPWGRLPADMGRFKRLTLHQPVVMGRKTWDSLPRRPLPKRANVVVSRLPDYRAEGAFILGQQAFPECLISQSKLHGEVFVIGGESIFLQSLPLASRVYLTLVHGQYEGDRWFPLDLLLSGSDGWREVGREEVPARPPMFIDGAESGFRRAEPPLTFIDYERKGVIP